MTYNKISAEIIADSINEFGDRITSMVLIMPRSILAELNTHRMLSKNSASSRAIPFARFSNNVLEDTFYPIAWQQDHSGMQGSLYITDPTIIDIKRELWKKAAKKAVKLATIIHNKILLNLPGSMQDEGSAVIPDSSVTKQICNRMLEPYSWHKVLVTATEWANFVALRAHKDAEIHIEALAESVLNQLNSSTPKQLKAGEWHIPYGDKFDQHTLESTSFETGINIETLKVKIAIARCARVSYDNFDNSSTDYKKDLELFNRLFVATPIHASPAEHVAYAMNAREYVSNVRGTIKGKGFLKKDNLITFDINENRDILGWCRNFRGWVQYRTLLINDTVLKDERIK